MDLWRVDPRGGLPRRLTDSPALDLAPAWSPDGEAELVVPDLESRSWGNWVLAPEGVVFVAKTPDHRAALLEWTEGSGTRELARLDGWPLNPSLAAGPDGRWLLWSQTEPGDVESDLMLLEGL